MSKTPRTDEIMLLMRKAFNTPHIGKGLKYLEAAHDAVEQLEKDYIRAKNSGTEAPAKAERDPDAR